MPRTIQCTTDRSNTAVHHVTRCDHIASRIGLHDCLAAQYIDAFVVDHITVANQAVMTMAAVRIQRDVTDDAQSVTDFLFDRTHGSANQVFRIGGFCGIVGF